MAVPVNWDTASVTDLPRIDCSASVSSEPSGTEASAHGRHATNASNNNHAVQYRPRNFMMLFIFSYCNTDDFNYQRNALWVSGGYFVANDSSDIVR